MRITYDHVADAVYVRLAAPDGDDGQTTVTEQGVIVDLDANGEARGFEFLSVRTHGLPLDGVPREVARALEAFVATGALDAGTTIEEEYP